MKILKFGLAILGTIAAMAIWSGIAVFGGFSGWWMKSIAPQGNHAAFIAEARAQIDTQSPGNAAFLLFDDGEIVGEHYAIQDGSVDADMVFPTASFSKWITALGVMSLIEDGRLSLDAPISRYLTRWQLPDGPFNEDQVTVRRLLSHTAGLTDGLGFGDYRADETLPGLEQSLTNPRASTDRDAKITVGMEPGTTFAYSGGGYLILQLLIEEATGQDYARYIREAIHDPLAMERSSFDFIGEIDGATPSFDATGAPAEQFQYAAAGATGFSSSTGDLAKLIKAILTQGSALGLSPETLQAMRKPEAFVYGAGIWGLGTMLYAPTRSGNDFIFGHDGANEPAINVSVRINPENGNAFIMLVNGHPSLSSDLGAEWVLWQTGNPDFLSTERALKSAILPALLGSIAILILLLLLMRRMSKSGK